MNNSITQRLQYKQSVVKFSYKFGVTMASKKFNENRRTIYRWRNRYDGTLESLKDYSRKPHYHPNQHTAEEIKMIKDYKNNNKNTGLVVFWVILKRNGYTRTIQGLYHVMRKLGIYKKAPSKRKHIQPPEVPIATYPGERVQIDVKFVPMECLTKELKEIGERYFQYTAIDEYTRLRYTYFCKEHTTYESAKFVDRLIKYFPFRIKLIQTDNGFEFTNKYIKTKGKDPEKSSFTLFIEKNFKKHKTNPPACPTYDSEVETFHWSIERDCLAWDDIVDNDTLIKYTTEYIESYNKSIIKTRGYSPIDKIKTALELDKINIPKPQLLTV